MAAQTPLVKNNLRNCEEEYTTNSLTLVGFEYSELETIELIESKDSQVLNNLTMNLSELEHRALYQYSDRYHEIKMRRVYFH